MRVEPGRILRAVRTPDGPVSVELRAGPGVVHVAAWGPGADFAIDRAPALLGCEDPPEAFQPEHPRVAELVRRLPGVRLAKSWAVAEQLQPIVLQQLVTAPEALRAFAGLALRFGEPAPGPHELLLRPSPRLLSRLPWHRYVAAGALRKQGETIARLSMVPRRMEEATSMSAEHASARLQAIRGIGPWTAAMTMTRGMGFADEVATGDFHLPNMVAWFLAGEARADDARMLELLEPFAGHRGRLIRLMLLGGVGAPKRGPRQPFTRRR
jgi:3-methyladenine DNA glycosylase/8-oxoguanine DNA glycosylase